MKDLADNKINVTQKIEFGFLEEQKTLWRKLVTSIFSSMFTKGVFAKVDKSLDCAVEFSRRQGKREMLVTNVFCFLYTFSL